MAADSGDRERGYTPRNAGRSWKREGNGTFPEPKEWNPAQKSFDFSLERPMLAFKYKKL